MRCQQYAEEQENLVYITVNGRGDTVLLFLEEFKQMKAELELLKNLAEAEDDVRNNRVSLAEDTFLALRKKLDM